MASKTRMLRTPDRAAWTFGQLLDWHLTSGTRPEGTPDAKGVPWQNKGFANSVGKESSEGIKNERTIRNWRNGETNPSPADFAAILLALFGGKPIYADWRAELTEKYHRARGEEGTQPASEALRSSLPTKPLRCLGRDEDLTAVVEALIADRENTAVLVLGGPGMGKTTLTRQAAVDPAVQTKFGLRRWFVALETASNAEALERAIIVALGLDPASARFDAALARLGQAPGLLVLDNLETPWDGERDKVEAVLDGLSRISQLVILASIRGNEPPGGLRWSRQRTMHPLESPHDRDLLLDIATDIKPDDPHLAPLLKVLGGVPIAIELVAQQAAAHDTLAAIREEWDRVGIALAKRSGIEASRLTSLEISLELSFLSTRLNDHGRRLFSILGQLPGGIAPEDLRALLGVTAFQARQGLLSTALAIERGERIDLLPPLRDHARRLHSPSHHDSELWRRHYLALVRDHGTRIGEAEGSAAVQRLTPELPNFDAAQRAALSAGQIHQAVEVVFQMERLMSYSGMGTTTTIRDLAGASRRDGNPLGEANCILNLGDIAFHRSDHDAARKAYEQALPLYRQVGEIRGEANCIQNLGTIAMTRWDLDAALSAYEQARPLYRQLGDILGEANCIYCPGDIALRRSDYDAARTAYEQALPLYRQIGNILGEANCIQRLGEILARRNDHDAARQAYEQALPLFRQIGAMVGEASCIKSLGDTPFDRSDHDAARTAYEQALPLFRQVGHMLGEASCIKSLGDIALRRSDYDAARTAYEQALPLYRQVGAILGQANCIKSLGDIGLARSNDNAAHTLLRGAYALSADQGPLQYWPCTLFPCTRYRRHRAGRTPRGSTKGVGIDRPQRPHRGDRCPGRTAARAD